MHVRKFDEQNFDELHALGFVRAGKNKLDYRGITMRSQGLIENL